MRRFKLLLILFIFIVIFFRKFFFLGLIPIPFNLLINWFFPYNSGGWSASGLVTPYKGGHFASDAIRQIYPWKELVIDLIQSGEIPLWNPYSFSGTPLLANMQSSVFNPLNLFFFIIPNFPFAWAFYIASTVIFSIFFMCLFLKSLNLKNFSVIFGSIAFASSGYMIVWLEWGTVAFQLVWLPLTLLAVKKWWDSGKLKHLLLFVFSASTTVFAGYPQGAAYNFIIVASFILFLHLTSAKRQIIKKTLNLAIAFVLALGISGVQWLPTAELFFRSAMRGEVSQNLSYQAALPVPQLATLIAPDFFGNRVTENYWAKQSFSGVDYMDADLYIGASALLFAVLVILSSNKPEKKWLISLVVLGVVLGLKTPITLLIARLGIPVISTGAASEALLISIFALTVLSAFGVETVLRKKYQKKYISAFIIVAGFFSILLLTSLFFDKEKTIIAQRSLVVPFTGFFIGSAAVFLWAKKRISLKVLKTALFIALSVELLFHANKILPFSSSAFAFPKHQLIEELRAKAEFNRVAGFWEHEIATDFHTKLRLFSAEGYDPLYPRRYGEFISSAEEGRLARNIPRSDADITQTNETNRNRLIDLTSVKYIQSKVTNPEETWEIEPLKYDPERFKLVWQQGHFKIYENLLALPRVKLFFNWQVLTDDQQIIAALYDQQFNPQQKVILEKQPKISKSVTAKSKAQITGYKSSRVEIKTQTDKPGILMLTDSYFPGWIATIDGRQTEILRANYTFRALVIPEGKHTVVFKYQPPSFEWGARISLISIIAVLTFSLARLSVKKIKVLS